MDDFTVVGRFDAIMESFRRLTTGLHAIGADVALAKTILQVQGEVTDEVREWCTQQGILIVVGQRRERQELGRHAGP